MHGVSVGSWRSFPTDPAPEIIFSKGGCAVTEIEQIQPDRQVSVREVFGIDSDL